MLQQGLKNRIYFVHIFFFSWLSFFLFLSFFFLSTSFHNNENNCTVRTLIGMRISAVLLYKYCTPCTSNRLQFSERNDILCTHIFLTRPTIWLRIRTNVAANDTTVRHFVSNYEPNENSIFSRKSEKERKFVRKLQDQLSHLKAIKPIHNVPNSWLRVFWGKIEKVPVGLHHLEKL